MADVIIQSRTTTDPITLMGEEAGCCWDADITNPAKNYKRGIDCIECNHGRVMEYPQIYMILDNYSARVMREYYTHIGGDPTRLQSSTRYIDYKNFDYITPPSVLNKSQRAKELYNKVMTTNQECAAGLEEEGVPREDIAMILPLGMATKVVVRTNLRNLVDMSHQRLCTRAYWEYRDLMKKIIKSLSEYSPEWETIVNMGLFASKCEILNYCPEKRGCGRYPKREESEVNKQ